MKSKAAKRVFGTKEWAKYNANIAQGCEHGCRYCLPSGTKISTPNGDVAVEDICEGDTVFGWNGEGWDGEELPQQTVQEVYERPYKGKIIRVRLDDGKELLLTPTHTLIGEDGEEIAAENLTIDKGIIVE